MKTSKNSTKKKDWQKADARILGQILAAQNIDFALPDSTRIAEFFAETLIAIPGIKACRVCLHEVRVQRGAMEVGICESCEASREKVGTHEKVSSFEPGFKCELAGQPGMQLTAIVSPYHHFGFFIFEVNDLDAFNVYKPFINNLANYVALSLENRQQRDLLQKARDELERKVEERTQDLVVANVHLQEEIEIKQRTEEALRMSEKQIKQLIDFSPVAMVVSSGIEERVDFVNDKFVELFGYTIEHIPDVEHWWPLAYPDETYRVEIKTQWEARAKRAISDKSQVEPMQATVTCKDGSHRYVEFRLSSIGQKHLVTFVDLTERKRMEEALSASEAELRTLINAMTDVIFVGNSEGRYLKIVDTSPSLLYKPPKELLGRTLHEVFPKDLADFFLNHLRQALNTQKSVNFEYSLPIGDKKLWFYATVSPMTDDKILMVARDITERKQAEEMLSKREQEFRTLAENSPDVIVRYDREGRRIYVNPEFERVNHLSAQEVQGKTPIELSTELAPKADVFTEKLMAAMASGTVDKIDLSWTKDGKPTCWFVRLVPEFDADGKVVSALTIWSDISERKRAEEALRESEEKYRLLHENAGVGIGYYKPDGEVISYNHLAASHMQGSPDDFKGKSIYEIFPKQDADFYMDRINRSSAAESTLEYEDHLNLPSGEKWFLSIFARICDLQKNVIGVQIISQDITERKQSEEVLKRSEEKYRTLIQKIQVAVVVHGADTQILTSNSMAQELLGLTEDQMLGKTAIDSAWHFFLEDGTTMPLEKYPVNQVIASRNVLRNFIVRVHRPNKENDVWVLINADPVFGKEDEITQVIVTFIDITERKQVEEALHESEWRYREVFDNVLDSLFLLEVTDDGRFRNLEMNPAIEKSTGIPRTQMIGKLIEETVPEETASIVNAKYRRCVEAGHPIEEDAELDLPAGRRYFHSTLIPARDETGRIHRIIGISRDITERRQVEMALSRERELLLTLVENLPVEVYVKDRERRFLLGNRLIVHALGAQSVEEIMGKRDEDFMPPYLAKQFADEENEIMRTGKPLLNDEHTPPHKPGPKRWYLRTKLPLRDGAGNIIGLMGLGNEITERKQAEEKIRRLNQELEQRVAERTAQLEAANKELDAFAFSVSHDLRAPLRHIDGFIEMLQKRAKTTLDDQSRHYMEVIADSATKMGTLIDDLLSFSRMGRNEMFKSKVDLDELFQDVIHEFWTETEGRDIQWKISPLPVIMGDRAMLHVVLVNLISNALKFTRPRKIAQIEIGCEWKNETEVVVFIRDNGVGFDMKYVDKLFGVFQRLHRADEFEGTGIGLANIHRIISRHGGRAWAEGEVDHGAAFYFSLSTSK